MLLNQIMGPVATMIEPGDRDAFAEVTEQLSGGELAVVIQSPGGYAETTEALVGQLRSRFGHIQAVVPVFAKSAATMLALSADELLLDEHSELGPIDPQFTRGAVVSPAQGILDQFKQATEQIKQDPATLPAWAPILQQYAPSLLQDARQALDLAREMVTGWLESYMFRNRRDAHKMAERVARYFAGEDPKDPMRSHSRPIGIDRAKEIRLRVRDMRARAELQRCVRELHHAVNITLSSTQAYKLVENSLGQSYIRGLQVQTNVQVAQPLALPAALPPAPTPSG
jgi:Serine dehydrogenase proteinase